MPGWRQSCSVFSTCLMICLSGALEVKPCTRGGAVQVEENSKDMVFACDGFVRSQPLSWLYKGRFPQDVWTVIANCSGTTCTSLYNSVILATTNQHTGRSHVIIPDVLRERFPDGTWSCHNGGQSARCVLDVIHKPVDSQCGVIIDEKKSMVTGECQIPKMYSSQGSYSCTWFEGTENQPEVEIQPSLTQLTLTNCSEGLQYYVCGHCYFQKSLSLTNGRYSYRVVISPGSVQPAVRYTVATNSTSKVCENDSKQVPMIVGIVIAAIIVVIAVVFAVICCQRRRKRQREKYGQGLADRLQVAVPTSSGSAQGVQRHNLYSDPVSMSSQEHHYSSIPQDRIHSQPCPRDCHPKPSVPLDKRKDTRRTLPAVPAANEARAQKTDTEDSTLVKCEQPPAAISSKQRGQADLEDPDTGNVQSNIPPVIRGGSLYLTPCPSAAEASSTPTVCQTDKDDYLLPQPSTVKPPPEADDSEACRDDSKEGNAPSDKTQDYNGHGDCLSPPNFTSA